MSESRNPFREEVVEALVASFPSDLTVIEFRAVIIRGVAKQGWSLSKVRSTLWCLWDRYVESYPERFR